jgi:hypothetical protein
MVLLLSTCMTLLLLAVGHTYASPGCVGMTLSTEYISANNVVPISQLFGLHGGLQTTPTSIGIDSTVAEALSAWSPFAYPMVSTSVSTDSVTVAAGCVHISISESANRTSALSDTLLNFMCQLDSHTQGADDGEASTPATVVLDERETQTISISVATRKRPLGPVLLSASLSLNHHVGVRYYHLDTVGWIAAVETDGETSTEYVGTMRRMFESIDGPDGQRPQGYGWSADVALSIESHHRTSTEPSERVDVDLSERAGTEPRDRVDPGNQTRLIERFGAYVRLRDLAHRMVWKSIKTETSSIDTRVERVGPDGFIYLAPVARITEHVSDMVETRQPTLEAGIAVRLPLGISISIEQLRSQLAENSTASRISLRFGRRSDRSVVIMYDTQMGLWSVGVSLGQFSLRVDTEAVDLASSRAVGASLQVRMAVPH